MKWIRSLIVVAVLAIAALGFTQLNRYATMPEASVFLVGQANFQGFVSATPAQVKTINNALGDYANTASKLMAQYQKDRAHKEKYNVPLRAAQKKLIRTCLACLSAAQRSRLGELGIQYYGVFSVISPDVAKALRFTPQQVTQSKKYYMTFFNTMDTLSKERVSRIRAVPQPKNPKDTKQVEAYKAKIRVVAEEGRDEDRRKLLAIEKDMQDRTTKLLTPAQRGQFEKMKGKIVDVKKR